MNVRSDFLNQKFLFSDIREEMQCNYDCAAWVALVIWTFVDSHFWLQ